MCNVFIYALLEAAALPSVFTLGKEPFAFGKVRSAKFFSAKGLCRVLFIGALGKIKKNCRVFGATLGKIFRPLWRRPLTVILPSARPSTRHFFLKKNYFAECPSLGTRQSFFFLKKITLPSALVQALGKVFFIFLK